MANPVKVRSMELCLAYYLLSFGDRPQGRQNRPPGGGGRVLDCVTDGKYAVQDLQTGDRPAKLKLADRAMSLDCHVKLAFLFASSKLEFQFKLSLAQ
jgi:hypothetical protein